MNIPDFTPTRIVTRVYQRNKSSFQPKTTTVAAKEDEQMNILMKGSPASSNSAAAEEEELFSRSPSARSSRRCTTPPSTPKRKRNISSQFSSPGKSPSKIKLDRELGKLLSPNGRLPEVSARINLSNCEDEFLIASPLRIEPITSPNHMKPRPPRKFSRWPSLQDHCLDEDKIISRLKEESTSQEVEMQSSTLMAIERRLNQPHVSEESKMRTSKRVLEYTDESDQQQVDDPPQIPASNEPNVSMKSCWNGLSQRWAELDDIDHDDEQNDSKVATKSITGLRNSGKDRQSREDFEYHVIDLKATSSLNFRRSACTEICKRVLSEGDGESEGSSEGDPTKAKEDKEASHSTSLGPFLRYVKSNCLVETLWRHMREAGAGKGNDEVLDLALSLICAKISDCDQKLLKMLIVQSDFYEFIIDTLRVKMYPEKGARRSKKVIPLVQLAHTGELQVSDEGSWIGQASLATLAQSVSISNQSLSHSQIDIRKMHRDTNISNQLWLRFAAERKKINAYGSSKLVRPDCRDIYLIAQIMIDCIDQIQAEDLLEGSIEDIIMLLQHFTRRGFEESDQNITGGKESIQTLAILLQMVIELISTTEYDWRSAFLRINTFLQYIVETGIEVAARLVKETEEGYEGVFNLLLALLTDLVSVNFIKIRSMMLIRSKAHSSQPKKEENIHPLALMGQLLNQLKKRAETNAVAGYLNGSLAIYLAFLIVGNPTKEKDAQITSNDDIVQSHKVLSLLCQGFEIEDTNQCITVLISTIEDFAATFQMAKRTHRAIFGKVYTTANEIEEDAQLFKYLISSLRIVEQLYSDLHLDTA